jgi:hypothetical protein
MNRTELKKMLKPLIKECIKEVIFEEGVLSTLISEVVRGTSSEVIVETKRHEVDNTAQVKSDVARNRKLQETRKRMAAAIGKEAYAGVFENTEPLRTGGSDASPSSPLASYAPEDAGVNIEGLLSVAGDKWGKLRG